MWIFRYLYCLINGHAYVDVNSRKTPYHYCLRCGKVKEPVAVVVRSTVNSH